MLVSCVENPMAPILVYGCVTLLTGILSLHISPETRKENQLDSFLFISVFLLIYFFVRPGIVVWIRIRSDLNLSAGSGSGKIHSNPSSSKSEMNLK
jgi:hypothetical protein